MNGMMRLSLYSNSGLADSAAVSLQVVYRLCGTSGSGMGGAAYALRGMGVCEVGGLVPAVHKCERDITHTSTQVRPPLVVLVVSFLPCMAANKANTAHKLFAAPLCRKCPSFVMYSSPSIWMSMGVP